MDNESSVRVLLTLGSLKDTWIAVCLEHYIAAQGNSTEAVIREFKAMFAAEIIYGMEHGNADQPLAGIEPAPDKYWQMFEAATPFDPPSMPLNIIIESARELPDVGQMRLAA